MPLLDSGFDIATPPLEEGKVAPIHLKDVPHPKCTETCGVAETLRRHACNFLCPEKFEKGAKQS